MKEKLQDITPYKVMNIKECLEMLDWTYTKHDEQYNDIACKCGSEMSFSGFFTTEIIECTQCKKRIVDLFSPIKTGNATCTILNPNDFDISDGRHWIAINE